MTPFLLLLACSLSLLVRGWPALQTAGPSEAHSRPVTSQENAARDRLSRAQTAFALDLYRQLAAQPGNLSFSPTSLFLALAMVEAGAKGETAAEIERALHLKGCDDVAAALRSLEKALAPKQPGRFELSLVHRLWADRQYAIEPAYLAAIADRFDADVGLADFAAAPEAATKAINAWVAEHTGGRIANLLPPPPAGIQPLTRVILTNALYFKSRWASPFETESTRSEPFTRADAVRVTVKMMHSVRQCRVSSIPGAQVVELPYAAGETSLFLILPDPGGMAELERQLSPGLFDTIEATRTSILVDLALPRFRLETGYALTADLAALGITRAFSDEADFSGIHSSSPLKISSVFQRCFLQVDESGTEAAAATAVMVLSAPMRAQPDSPIPIHFDRPFLCVLRHTATGAPLFVSRVDDPTQ